MANMPSGTPIPTPIAVGRVVEGSSLWADTAGSVDDVSAREDAGAAIKTAGLGDVLAEEDATTGVAFELGPAENVVVASSLGVAVRAD